MDYKQALDILKKKHFNRDTSFSNEELTAIDVAIMGLEILVNRHEGRQD